MALHHPELSSYKYFVSLLEALLVSEGHLAFHKAAVWLLFMPCCRVMTCRGDYSSYPFSLSSLSIVSSLFCFCHFHVERYISGSIAGS